MSVSNKAIGGDVSVGRNVAMGGKAIIQGNAVVGHDLRVKGYLEAPNIIGINKGVYDSEESLNSAYPQPKNGWIAGVMGGGEITLWRVEEGEWVETEDTMTFAFNSSYYDSELDQLQDDVRMLLTSHFDGIEFTTKEPFPGSLSVVASRVLYSITLHIFVAEDVQGNLYLNWNNGMMYNSYVEGVPTSIANKIFVNDGNGRLYYRSEADSHLEPIYIGLSSNLGAENAGKTLKVDEAGNIVAEKVNYEEHLFLTERQWETLSEKRPDVLYCVYEDEGAGESDFIKVEGETMFLSSTVTDGILIVNARVANGVLEFVTGEISNSYVENGVLYTEGEVDANGVFSISGAVTNNILTL